MKKLFLIALLSLGLQSCTKTFIGGQPDVSPREVFEELWHQMNIKYSYMQYKGLDWDAIYTTYSPQVNPNMTDIELFRVLESMMNELRDGHANLVAPFSVSNYYPVFLNSPENFRSRLVLQHYLRRNPQAHFITGPFQHTILDTLGKKIGLITYRSFSSGFSNAELDFIFSRFQDVDGVIVDMRSNGGGAVPNVFKLAGRFTDVERVSHYNVMKIGPGANDFGEEKLIRVIPSSSAIRFTGRVAMLTNRGSYSATSDFALQMRALPNARLVGDTTGGGLGLPHGASLINGWSYRFSVGMALSPETDANGDRFNWEDGVPPHIRVDLDLVQAEQGFDSMIERAIDYIINGN